MPSCAGQSRKAAKKSPRAKMLSLDLTTRIPSDEAEMASGKDVETMTNLHAESEEESTPMWPNGMVERTCDAPEQLFHPQQERGRREYLHAGVDVRTPGRLSSELLRVLPRASFRALHPLLHLG
jgi:hypothetical protein